MLSLSSLGPKEHPVQRAYTSPCLPQAMEFQVKQNFPAFSTGHHIPGLVSSAGVGLHIEEKGVSLGRNRHDTTVEMMRKLVKSIIPVVTIQSIGLFS